MDKLQQLLEKIKAFRDERDWIQFHNHKDMAAAISIEASELLEHFLWKDRDELNSLSEETMGEIKDEIGDIMIFYIELCDNLGIDPIDAATRKLEKNKLKYPVDKAKGRHTKYTKLQ